MSTFFIVLKIDFKNLWKNPVTLFINTVFIVLLAVILGSLNSGEYANGYTSYKYYIITFIVYCMVNGATTTSNCFMERSIKNANLRVVLSPTGSFTVYFSKIVASAIFNLICHIAVLLISIPLFHLYFPAESIAVFVCMMIPIEFASSGLGAFCCCLMKSEEGASSVLAMGIAILALVGGSFFSMERLGNMMRNASYFSPIRWLNQASFTVLFDHNYTAVMPVILISIAVFGAFLFGCAKSFHMEDYLC